MPRGGTGSQRTGGAISIIGLRKEFDGVTAVDGIDLEIEPGEFFTLLGPSGCGKTTTLRMLGGFEQPTAGQIFLDGIDVAQTPPHKRPVNTVFQSYALFPHVDVQGNVAYGLQVAQGSRQEGTRRSRREGAGAGPAHRVRSASPSSAVRGTAAARGPGAGSGPRTVGAAPGRATGRARREAPPFAAGGADRAAARSRHHLRLRHPRPGGSTRDVEPARRHGRWPHHAARDPARGLPGTAHRVRRGLPGRRQPVGHRVPVGQRPDSHRPLRRVHPRGAGSGRPGLRAGARSHPPRVRRGGRARTDRSQPASRDGRPRCLPGLHDTGDGSPTARRGRAVVGHEQCRCATT